MIPTADVLAVRGRTVIVRCPYCHDEHTHTVEHLGGTERRAPGCGLIRTADQRGTGYLFTTTERRPQR